MLPPELTTLAIPQSGDLVVAITALIAAVISGAIGYGFSTLLVPVALLFYASRVLNPGLVLAEIALNLLGLWLNRRSLPRVFRRMLPMIVASVPGIVLGVLVLKVAAADVLRLVT
ncbi:MAG TPA: sulfite exporter TauE/SafE family protein, partial [Pseudomonadota bacterium]|nr:sulfite exporter TauE/SafE family protein [Pseudomonadota bacterium]